ncbi:MAG: cyclic nucleotide-binding domain-containing protein [Pseudomonadota bacterium]
MSLSPEQLHCIPFLSNFSNEQITLLASVFEKRNLAKGDILFEAGKPAQSLYLLAEGEVSIFKEDELRYQLHPPAPIGELGALAGLTRNTTATASQPSEVWQVSREALLNFFESHNDIALPFYQTLVSLIADKVSNDQLRLEDMRRNIIRTQKAMKKMRDYLLESQETPVSETLHNTLEDLIKNNRRVNYRVKPPKTICANIRTDDDSIIPVTQISRTHVSFHMDQGDLPDSGAEWSGVLRLDGPEIPISGTVLRTIGNRVDLELDLLIDEYSSTLDGYLTRIQLLDFML